jgi:2-aminoethylphosphonate transport system permease protein
MRRLVYTEASRRGLALLALLLATLVFGLPLLMLVLASVAGQWNGVLPSQFTLEHLQSAAVGGQSVALWHSLATGLSATSISVVLGAWGALAARGAARWVQHVTDSAYLLPIALPSVSIGLALLIAFSRPPLLLNGSVELVVLTHVVLVTAYAYANAKAGLERIPPGLEDMADSLGAAPRMVMLHVTLPLLIPHLLAAAALGFALSMGELGATIMLYPPQWVTAPVDVFTLTDRGSVFSGAAASVLLLACTFAVLLLLNRVSRR